VISFKEEVQSLSEMYFVRRAYLFKRSRRPESVAMPHLSVSMSKPFSEVAQNGIDKEPVLNFG
jgi:hypothetical protein